MTEKQKRFADYYIELGNATQSAIKAGYSKKTAYSIGQRLLKNVEIATYTDERLAEMQEKRIADGQEVLQYLTSVMRGERKEETLKGIGMGEQELIKIEVSEKDKLKAAELLAKRYGLLKEVQELDIQSITFVDDVPLLDDD